MLYKALGLGVKQNTLNDILSHHIPRHIWATVILLMTYLLGEEGKEKFISLLEETPRDHYGKIPDADEFIISLGKESIKVIEEENYKKDFNPIMDWWTTAETKKQQGFYIDYKDKKWSTPAEEVSMNDYETSYKQVSEIINMANESVNLFSALSDKELKEFKLMLKPLMNSWKQLETIEG